MKASKYQQTYDRIRTANVELFSQFSLAHQDYEQNAESGAAAFHATGQKVLDLLRGGERTLCSGMMKGGYASYSSQLAEKYWALIKKDFPLIDQVGVRKRVVHQS